MQNENLKFSFGNVHITIKWIPEGWLAIVNVKDANVSMDIVPDKKHIWTPRADDWQVNTVFAFHKKKAKSIRTPSGWLFYILNKESWKASHTSKSYVSTKYIHDPENVFNPDETVEKKKSEPETIPIKDSEGKQFWN
ncbi:MAG: hypothetical protein U9N63_08915 [Pseudomonadota bacterium]|nr:hypothetical protein [Pseudomonadota bacterium]